MIMQRNNAGTIRVFAEQALNDPEGFEEIKKMGEMTGQKVVMVDALGGYVGIKGKIDFEENEKVMQDKFGLNEIKKEEELEKEVSQG